MKRREFIQVILKTVSVIAIGTYAGILSLKSLPAIVSKKTTAGQISKIPRRFTRALRYKKYPGSVKPLSNLYTIGKWRG